MPSLAERLLARARAVSVTDVSDRNVRARTARACYEPTASMGADACLQRMRPRTPGCG